MKKKNRLWVSKKGRQKGINKAARGKKEEKKEEGGGEGVTKQGNPVTWTTCRQQPTREADDISR